VRAPKEHLRESRPPRPILAPCAETSPRSGGWIQKRPLRKLNLQLVSTFGRSAGCNPPRPPPSSPLKRPFAELPRPRPTCWPNCHRAVCLLRLFRPCDARQSPELDRSNPGEPPMAPPCRRSGAGSVADEFSLPPSVGAAPAHRAWVPFRAPAARPTGRIPSAGSTFCSIVRLGRQSAR
jgi:hypothetical protein